MSVFSLAEYLMLSEIEHFIIESVLGDNIILSCLFLPISILPHFEDFPMTLIDASLPDKLLLTPLNQTQLSN